MQRTARFADWASLGEQARHMAATAAAEHARLLEPRLHAFVSLDGSAAPAGVGDLAGEPYAAKDIFATQHRRPTCGLGHSMDIGFKGDAEVLRRLDNAGAVRIGFCAMTALAFQPSGYSTVRNPWNADFIAGGSSSGSAVAVASGSVTFSLGSDTGGSVRIPAHACGVTAWKPTAGLVSVQGAMALAPTLDTIGLLARSATDISAPVRILAERLSTTRPIARAVVLADVLDAAEPAVRCACEAGVEAIAAAGVTIERRDARAVIEEVDTRALVLLHGEPPRVHRARIDDAALDPMLRKRLSKGLVFDEDALAASRAARTPLREGFIEHILGNADVALLPVMPIRTPARAVCDPASPEFDARILYRLSEWTRFVNMLGFPAVAMPVGFDDRGLPVAMQIVGRPDADLAMLALVKAVQKLTDWHGRIPVGVADLVGNAEMAT